MADMRMVGATAFTQFCRGHDVKAIKATWKELDHLGDRPVGWGYKALLPAIPDDYYKMAVLEIALTHDDKDPDQLHELFPDEVYEGQTRKVYHRFLEKPPGLVVKSS